MVVLTFYYMVDDSNVLVGDTTGPCTILVRLRLRLSIAAADTITFHSGTTQPESATALGPVSYTR
jgi:hypothetical protein